MTVEWPTRNDTALLKDCQEALSAIYTFCEEREHDVPEALRVILAKYQPVVAQLQERLL
jgi:hypothetical protein